MDKNQALAKLDLSGNPSKSEVKKTYRKLELKCHPDKHANKDESVKKTK